MGFYGRLPEPIEFSIVLDKVTTAVGERPEIPEGFSLLANTITIEVNPDTLATSKEGVFAGGLAETGPASVIEAIAVERKGASFIDK